MVQQIGGPTTAKTDKRFEVFLARAEFFHSSAGADPIHAVLLAHHYTDRLGGGFTDGGGRALTNFLRKFGSWSAVVSIKPIIASLYEAGFEGVAGGTVHTGFVDRMSALDRHYQAGQLKVVHTLIIAHFYATDSSIAALATQMGKGEMYQEAPKLQQVFANTVLRWGGFRLSDWALKRAIGWVETNIDGGIFDGYDNKHIADAD